MQLFIPTGVVLSQVKFVNFSQYLRYLILLNLHKGCGIDISGTCAHERSNLFYSESINSDRFVARQCTGYSEIVARNCPGTGTIGIMGGDAGKTLRGVFFLETNAESPFARG